MLRLRSFLALIGVSLGPLLGAACSDSAGVTATRSLLGASDVSVFCAARDDDGNLVGRPLTSCPDVDGDDNEVRRLYALVTQKETGEVAVVDMSSCADAASCEGRVLDLETTQPGTNFLPVGAEPVSIVSTEGGIASFVAVAEPGREGIFALPTSCVGRRPSDALFRDLRTWPACRLPVSPGDMAILTAPDATTLCDGSAAETTLGNEECPADVNADLEVPGRKKLAVALPSLGQIAILDAQTILDLPQGAYDACPIESVVTLAVDLPPEPIGSSLPEDLQATPDACLPRGFEHAATQTFAPNPSDFAYSDGTLYVSDYDAPVVHVLDASNPCDIQEEPPLLPQSFLDPTEVVTTRKVAVSPVTPSGKQYVYAIDNSPRGAGSVMMFDVSREGGMRTPIIRPRSDVITTEPPDRLRFDQEAADIDFALHDFPAPDPRTGVAVEGVQCDPSPEAGNSLGALYRPDTDEGDGANPRKLRGAFAFVVLHSGFVITVDIEDLDAPCRRPKQVNPESVPDEHGCFDDSRSSPFESKGVPTVTDELSCNIVEPHRARAAGLFYASGGGSAPALRAFPQLRDRTGASLTTDQSDSGKGHPRLLGINRKSSGETGGDASVYIGATEYKNALDAPNRLVLDPALSERNSVVLPYEEPRAYSGNLSFFVTYEGAVRPPSDALLRVASVEDLALPEAEAARLPRPSYGVLRRGPNADYCSSGIEDDYLIRDRAAPLSAETSAQGLDLFASQYADYVDLASDLLPRDDDYWSSSEARACGEAVREASEGVTGRPLCDLVFGTQSSPNLTREFRVVRAFNDKLVVEPRRFSNETERRNLLDLAACCFPQNIEFRVRASQHWVLRAGGTVAHDIGVDPDSFACVRDCSPLVAGRNSRIFEISCESENGCRVDEETLGVVGPPEFEQDERSLGRSLVCVLGEHPSGGVQPGAPGSECVFQGPTARFAIYRGLLPSERDQQFSWRVLGGFTPLSVDLLRINSGRTSTSPERMMYVPQINRLLIADGGSTGLSFIGLRLRDGGPGFIGTAAF